MKNLKLETLKQMLTDSDCDVRAAAMNACNDRADIPLDIIKQWLTDSDCYVRTAAINACNGRSDIPLDIIKQGLIDSDWCVREGAMNACKGRADIPLDIIKQGLTDSDCDVRAAAMNACKDRADIPTIRTVNPTTPVYKKCLNGVIVVAEIPDDAQTRGQEGKKCRSDKAVIIDIIGDIYGEAVGISIYDKTITYRKGDKIIIKDFDYSDEECSTGFHFFLTKEEAEEYEG